MPDAARDARIWLVHVMEIADHEVPDALESGMEHLRRLLAECERLEAENERVMGELQKCHAVMSRQGKRIIQLEAQKLALVAYMRIKRKYDEQRIHGRFMYITQLDVEEAWQALGAELREAIDEVV